MRIRFLSTNLTLSLPEFKLSHGLGGALHVTLPPGQSLLVQRGCIISMSPKIVPSMDTEGGLLVALSRKSKGGSLLFENLKNSDIEPKKMMIAPKTFGSSVILSTNGISEFYVQTAAFLACTTTLTLSSKTQGLGLALNGYFNYLVKGRGLIALSSDSGLQTFVLAPQETVLINPKNLLAWESCLNPLPIKTDYTPPAIFTESEKTPSHLKYLKKIGLFLFSILRNSVLFTTNSILGAPSQYYKMKGPGTYVLSTQEPNRIFKVLQ